MQRVYISGKISGLEEAVYLQTFKLAAIKLRNLGYTPVNPAKGKIPGYKWEDYMKDDIRLLCGCDLIYQLPGWEESKGAKLEKQIADSLNIPVLELMGEKK